MIEYINTYFIGWSPRGFSESNFRVTDDVGETGSSYEITVIAFTYCNRNAILLNPVCIETMFTGHLALIRAILHYELMHVIQHHQSRVRYAYSEESFMVFAKL